MMHFPTVGVYSLLEALAQWADVLLVELKVLRPLQLEEARPRLLCWHTAEPEDQLELLNRKHTHARLARESP
jgi:hypothetical protein